MKFLLIGAFGFKTLESGGQPIKSRELYYLLCKKYGKDSIRYIDTYNWKKHPFSLFLRIFFRFVTSNIIIMLPAHNGVKVFSKLLSSLKTVFRKKIFYDVIGGWLIDLLDTNKKVEKRLRKFDCLFVESSVMKDKLIERGIRCCFVPNFKSLRLLSNDEISLSINYPLKLCIFSRITELKGISEAIDTVIRINEKDVIFDLDIYGQIDESYEMKFRELLDKSPNYISYKGCVESDKSVDVLKDYFALLFPTKFFTEGIPGTIIDAYFSAVPVISSKWLNFNDVVLEGKTGFGYEFNDFNNLYEVLLMVSRNPYIIVEMKKNCLKEAYKYTPDYAISIMSEYFDSEMKK